MLICRRQPRRLTSLARASRTFSNTTDTYPSSSASTSPTKPHPSQDSIFTAPESPWDHVFAELDNNPPLLPANVRKSHRQTSRSTPSKTSTTLGESGKGILGRSSSVRARKESMTAREISVFDEMFNLIFSAVSEHGAVPSSEAASKLDKPPSIGRTPSSATSGPNAPLNDLFRTLRRNSSRIRWTSAIDEELDRKKEQMELCNTDQELLEWAMKEVFGESVRWDEEATKGLEASAASTTGTGTAEDGKASTAPISPTVSSSAPTSAASSTSANPSPLQPSTYPHLLAHLMRIFRTTYSNPSLSLSIFTHAAQLSIPSYVFGCTAPAYNELIQAKWEGWGDLEGVCKALEEMRGNGVRGDGRTRAVVERVRREVGEAKPVEPSPVDIGSGIATADTYVDAEGRGNEMQGDINPLARRVWAELGGAEVMRLLTRIEELALREPPRKPRVNMSKKGWNGESWKGAVLQPDDEDRWEFGSWRRVKKDRNEKRGQARANVRPSGRKTEDGMPFDEWVDGGTPDENMVFR
ncbi:hypothetical protein PAXRUDRAFT_823727 [Paxillus rubicundulus Ve08.2h10]|uniref:Mtf2-like C-terminal domain-containing protein n=1 Tax=Paxillus rubicundulus Ve08.2h10 TaxID=930991 RepID=A0A0D0EC11_9AGAM|nr:hypothetical protein PAXRUDRAFT_823727 [Paxillus rubicundulus Ve08.2h10]